MLEVQKFTYHSHTDFSDGKSTAIEMVRQAKLLGFKEIGITDHLIVHKNMRSSPSCAINNYMATQAHIYNDSFTAIKERFQRHCDELRRLAQAENFPIYVGFEVDFFTYDGWLEEFDEFMRALDYDYLITGNHFLFDESGEVVYNLTDLKELSDDPVWCDELLKRHFATIKQAVESRRFKFLAHLDYARKLGEEMCGATAYKAEKLAILDALAATDTGMEVSTKGLHRINDFFPADWVIEAAARKNIALVISDDAHKTDEIGREFALAEQVMANHQAPRRLKF